MQNNRKANSRVLILKDSTFSVYLNSMSFSAFYLRFAHAYEFLNSRQAFPLLSLYVNRITVIILLWHNIYFVCGIGFWGSFIRMHAIELLLLLYSSPYFKCTKSIHSIIAGCWRCLQLFAVKNIIHVYLLYELDGN